MRAMLKTPRLGFALSTAWLAAAGAAGAQDADKLVRLIPNLYGPSGLVVDSEARLPTGQTHSAHFNSAFQSGFSQLNIALVSQIASVPLPSPASGYTYRYDPTAGVFVRSTGSFGPILADRAETIGKNKLSVGFSYQEFSFDTIEGSELKALPAVFTHDNPAPGGRDDVVTTLNSVDLKVQQYTTFITYGVSKRVDLALALPLVAVDLRVASEATVRRIGTSADLRVHFFRDSVGGFGDTRRFETAGSASGVGDVLARVKATAYNWGTTHLAVGADVRLPTGDEEDLLGSGAFGVRPFVVLSSVRRVAPHLDLGFQWNGKSLLAGNLTTGEKDTLPHQIVGAAGVDARVNDRVTLAVDLLARRTLDSPRLEAVTFRALDGRTTFPNIQFGRGAINSLDGSLGAKWNPIGRLLLDVNVLVKLNEGGIRDDLAWLAGIEYSF
jgi:hypothetical protein